MLEVEMTENAKSLLADAVLSLTELIEELRDVQLPAIGAPSAAAEVGTANTESLSTLLHRRI